MSLSFKDFYSFQLLLKEDNILNIDDLLSYAYDYISNEYKMDALFKKWVTREVKRYIATSETNFPTHTPNPNDPAWYKNVTNAKVFKYPVTDTNFISFLKKITNCLQFYNLFMTDLEKGKLLKMTVEDVYKKYDDLMKGSLIEGKDFKTVLNFKDGFKIIKLLTPKAYEQHGAKASNCVSSGFFSNCDGKLKSSTNIYGLYKNTKAKATIGVDGNKLSEVAFFSDKYRPYILEFIKKFNLKPDVYGGLSDEGLADWPPYEKYLDSIGFDREED